MDSALSAKIALAKSKVAEAGGCLDASDAEKAASLLQEAERLVFEILHEQASSGPDKPD